MIRRTKGRLLILLLVMTGMAGTLNTSSISKKERKFSVNLMKDSKSEVLQAVKGLSDEQLNYKPSAEQWSIKEIIYHVTVTEKNLWEMLEGVMKSPANAEKRSEIKMSDQELIDRISSREKKVKTSETLEPKNSPYASMREALEIFKISRLDHIRYMRETTEDLRNHVIQMPFGWIDAYQLTLLTAAHSIRHKKQIDELKAHPGFPK